MEFQNAYKSMMAQGNGSLLGKLGDFHRRYNNDTKSMLKDGEYRQLVEELVIRNKGTVKRIAYKKFSGVQGACFDYEDIEQWGIEGLVKAIHRYNPNSSASERDERYRFSSFTWKHITGNIASNLNVANGSFSSSQRKEFFGEKINTMIDEGEEKLQKLLALQKQGHVGTYQVSAQRGVIASLERLAERPTYLHETVQIADEEGGMFERTFIEIIEESVAAPDNATELAERNALRESVRNSLKCLTERQRSVIDLRFGLSDGEPKTLAQIAKIFGVTDAAIGCSEAKALRRLHAYSNRELRDFVDW